MPGETLPYRTICQRNFLNNREIYTRQWFLAQLKSDDSSKIIIEFVGTLVTVFRRYIVTKVEQHYFV